MFARLLFIVAVFALQSSAFAQQGGRRVALVIANGNYTNTNRLDNPLNDSRLIAESLRKTGFSVVDVRSDQSLLSFQQSLRDFRGKADGADVALIYYAGHGIEGQGKNWLIPTDAKLATERDLAFEAIDLDLVMQTIGGAKMRVAILDACRNNPFGQSWRAGTRAVSRGLAGIEVDNVLVIFAAAPGQTAADGDSGNSPFAASLARRLPEPGLPIQLLGGVVRDDVLAATGGAQRPFISASVTGTAYYLVPANQTAAPAQPQQASALIPPNSVAGVGASAPGGASAPSEPTASARSWTARQADLAMGQVMVMRTATGSDYLYQAAGIYPVKRLTGAVLPRATYIRVQIHDLATGGSAQVENEVSELTGSWQPGQPFMMSFRLPQQLVDSGQALSVRLCMGTEKNCVFSPDLARPSSDAGIELPQAGRVPFVRKGLRRTRKP
jgi:hypothetical protein